MDMHVYMYTVRHTYQSSGIGIDEYKYVQTSKYSHAYKYVQVHREMWVYTDVYVYIGVQRAYSSTSRCIGINENTGTLVHKHTSIWVHAVSSFQHVDPSVYRSTSIVDI